MGVSMTNLTFKGNPIETNGNLPEINNDAPEFTLVNSDLNEISLSDLQGKTIILNIFPSVDTPVCAMQLKKFSQKVSQLENVVLLFASLDLPFAFSRFCAAEGISNTITASDFRYHSLAKGYGVKMLTGPLADLYARAVIIINKENKIIYTELVSEVSSEPDYDKAMSALNG